MEVLLLLKMQIRLNEFDFVTVIGPWGRAQAVRLRYKYREVPS